MTVRAVVFDWGGTLTPWHDLDLLDLWLAAARQLAPDRPGELARALVAAEAAWWAEAERTNRSGTIDDVVAAAMARTGLDVDVALRSSALAAHFEAYTPHTRTDPDARGVLEALRRRGIATGLLSNTHWPRDVHESILERDGVVDLLDVRVYTSELEHVKTHGAGPAGRGRPGRRGVCRGPAARRHLRRQGDRDAGGAAPQRLGAGVRRRAGRDDLGPAELLPLVDAWSTV